MSSLRTAPAPVTRRSSLLAQFAAAREQQPTEATAVNSPKIALFPWEDGRTGFQSEMLDIFPDLTDETPCQSEEGVLVADTSDETACPPEKEEALVAYLFLYDVELDKIETDFRNLRPTTSEKKFQQSRRGEHCMNRHQRSLEGAYRSGKELARMKKRSEFWELEEDNIPS